MKSRLLALFALAACGGTSAPAPTAAFKLAPFVTTGLSAPLFLTQPLDDGRIFVVEQAGKIRIVKNGAVLATPFLDITQRVGFGGERGLLSVAFHPLYSTNHFFYIYFTVNTNGDIRIERFTTTSNPEVADPASSQLVLTIPHSQFENHNGGLLTFGPDGLLYAGVGDGGSGGDPNGNGQNPNALLASLLRFDVDHGAPYTIPPGNPFANGGGRPEIWAKGLRNPWRYTFDSGNLYIADVGQGDHEEVDVVTATRPGVNYGWNVTEGLSCYNTTACNTASFQAPVLDYPHDGDACSITGGYVYRGAAIPAIAGLYFYADFCSGFLRSFRFDGTAAAEQKDWALTLGSPKSFGRDFAGEMYVVAGDTVLKFAPL
jgi:glucose/arabinose dehydrogenase